jgi:hypothetical protein
MEDGIDAQMRGPTADGLCVFQLSHLPLHLQIVSACRFIQDAGKLLASRFCERP